MARSVKAWSEHIHVQSYVVFLMRIRSGESARIRRMVANTICTKTIMLAHSVLSLLNPCMPNVQNGERIVDPDKKSHAAIYIKRFGRLLAIIKGYSWSITWKVFFGARRVIHFLT